MAKVRAKFSPKSKYYISKHVFMICYHFCLNYDEWLEEYNLSVGLNHGGDGEGGGSGTGDPTSSQAIRLAELYKRIEIIRSTAYAVEPSIYEYLLDYVTHDDVTFNKLKAKGMPCERKMFYDRRRKFYWLMSKKLNL